METEKQTLAPLTKSTERALIIGLILLGWALIVTFRLFQLQVLAHDDYVTRATRQQQKVEPIDAPRGSIYDRNGQLLAISSVSHFAVVDPKRIPNKELAAALLARILGLDARKLQLAIETAAQSRRHNGYFVVDQRVNAEQAATLKAMDLDWLEIREGSVRTYPQNDVAAHVIGNVNGDGRGAAGVELKLDKELAGTPGLMRVERDGRQTSYASEIVKQPVMGKSIGLTVDREVQFVAKEALRDAVIQNHAEHGSVVAMIPTTGEILVLENYPTYDLNEHLLPGERANGREDLAVVAPFEPGSVFKVITLSAALETTNLRPETIINCGNGSITIFGRVVHDHKPYPALSMEDVLAFSSNIGAIRIGMQVGNKNLYDYIRRFGFGDRTGIELPAEAPGLLRPLKRWQPTSIGSVPMGHEIAVTSVQLAQAGSVIANGGFLVHPHLVAWRQAPGEEPVRTQLPSPPPTQVLNPETVMTMRTMMRRVVTEPGGTGHRLHLAGYTIAGKTGTAQIYDYAHHVYTHKYNASFMGFAPLENPAVVVVVTITGTTGEAGYGGSAAGPVWTKVMSTALRRVGVIRDVPEEIELLMAKEKAAEDKLHKKDSDADTVAALSNPPSLEEMRQASGEAETVVAENTDPNAPKVPNFVGKTVKDVMEEAAETGIEIDMSGDGLARAQSPSAGSLLLPGEHIQVRFAR
ncbi:MAG: transpeptidase family protein [Acidobacteriaceae bacterium]|nr:transpeptidase family protein [Acidobacteriaceae bacterium]MBV9501911.1 transpeptidase family protein [Acidobacteriaceae bacterium]